MLIEKKHSLSKEMNVNSQLSSLILNYLISTTVLTNLHKYH